MREMELGTVVARHQLAPGDTGALGDPREARLAQLEDAQEERQLQQQILGLA